TSPVSDLGEGEDEDGGSVFKILNLDTGEVRKLSEEELGSSAAPGLLAGARAPWREWWRQKWCQDEKFWAAAESGDAKALQETLEQRARGGALTHVDVRSLYGRTALHLASSEGHAACMEVLLEGRADVEARTEASFTALHLASRRGHAV
ncbi:unnamed protein product, partial [Polarella glacialis]